MGTSLLKDKSAIKGLLSNAADMWNGGQIFKGDVEYRTLGG